MTFAPTSRAETAAQAGSAETLPTATLGSQALLAHDAGLCVVPPHEDGSKRPLGVWKKYQTARPTLSTLEGWYSNGRTGIGIICGAVSGDLEMFEFEGRAVKAGIWQDFKTAAAEAGLSKLVNRVANGWTDRSPSGGLHLHWRCPEGIEGNLTLARVTDGDGEIRPLIETRGEGGYVVIAPTTIGAQVWQRVAGGFGTVATITATERRALLDLARTFDRMPQAALAPSTAPVARAASLADITGPTWADILEPHGWIAGATASDGNQHWARPGKPAGTTSATINEDGNGAFYVFSSSTPFEAGTAYSKAGAFAILNPKPETAAPSTVGRQTLDDLPSGDPPDQLCDPYLSAEGVTVIYGLGGVGKGYVSVYLILQLVRQGRRVTVIDFENHPGEWGRRAHALGFTKAERKMVNYRAPFGDAWTVKRGPLALVAEVLRADLDEPDRRADYLVIDSYTTAASTGSDLGGAAAAQEFFAGISTLGRPALVIAHVAGGQDKFPDKPFGSVFVHNLARETWAVGRVGEPDDGPMTLELRNKKSNGRAISGAEFLTFTFDALGRVRVDDHKPVEASRENLVADVLRRSIKPMTVKEIARVIREDTGQAIRETGLRWTLEAHPGRFSRTEDTPYRWAPFKGL